MYIRETPLISIIDPDCDCCLFLLSILKLKFTVMAVHVFTARMWKIAWIRHTLYHMCSDCMTHPAVTCTMTLYIYD